MSEPSLIEASVFEPERGAEDVVAICRQAGDTPFAVALAALPSMGPATLRRLLAALPAPECWARIRAGTLARDLVTAKPGGARWKGQLERWMLAARASDPARELEVATGRNIRVHVLGDASYPVMFAGEPTAPAVLFTIGECAIGDGATHTGRVAIVGTRSCTHYGANVAAELGAGLAAEGVTVLSGLAAGIDAAAHEGALVHGDTAAPLAIVGGGVDVVYPAANRRLRSRIAAAGTLLSEAPPAAPPERWRFPLRNRLIAAAADVVVVVEAHRLGGAMHTVDAAIARGVQVAAVPGSVRSPASYGTNALLADGAALVRDADDVLVLLGLCRAARPAPTGRSVPEHGARTVGEAVSPAASSRSSRVLDALDEVPIGLEAVLRRSGLAIGEASIALEELVASGLVQRCGAGYERTCAARQ